MRDCAIADGLYNGLRVLAADVLAADVLAADVLATELSTGAPTKYSLLLWMSTMTELPLSMTAPFLSRDAAVWFSVYGFGWGYRAYALPHETVCTRLGAHDTSEHQLRVAFELGKRRILRAVEPCGAAPYDGHRIALEPEKL
jgi:hypothetical protein